MTAYLNASIMAIFLCTPLVFGLFLKKKKLLNEDITAYLIILTGVILRLIYITYTDVNTRQHDVHEFFTNEGGHAEYICYLLENRHLPDFDPRDIWQFYHPPLHHIICAVWLSVLKLFGIQPQFSGVNTLPFLTTIYSSLFCVFAYKSFKKLGIKSKALYISTALVTFHPTLIILAGSVNNDMLSSLFAMIAIYYTIKWSQDRKWLDIIMIALSIGLGMFTKLSVGLLAPAVAAVFLFVLIKQRKEIKKLIPQFVVFGVICIPLGLFWSVRNLIKFDVPLTYVPKLSENSNQFIDKTVFERLTDWSLTQFASPFTQWEMHGHPYNEYNPFIALLKNSMFDESTFFGTSITLQSFCTALLLVNIVLVAITIVAMFFVLIKNKDVKIEIKLLLGLIFAVIFGNYINFCINYPHVCTQNMRYCVPLIFTSAAFLGMFANGGNQKKSKLYKRSVAVLTKSTIAFSFLSAFVYTALLFYFV